MTCPIGIERLVAYWANDLSAAEADAVDEHVFGCAACARDAEGVHRVVGVFRDAIPPVITRDHVEVLRARGRVIHENEFEPDLRRTAVFERGVDLLIHRLRLDLTGADRVDVTVRVESGDTLAVDLGAPFDAARGEVLIACQRHFEAFHPDPNVVFDVRVHRGAVSTVATYFIPHAFSL